MSGRIIYTKPSQIQYPDRPCLVRRLNIWKNHETKMSVWFMGVGAGFVFSFCGLVDIVAAIGHRGDYIFTMAVGYICLLMSGLYISRLWRTTSWTMFSTRTKVSAGTHLLTNEYSVNLPTRFYYKKKWNDGWINVVNPFRASIVLGTPGSLGKSCRGKLVHQNSRWERLPNTCMISSTPTYPRLPTTIWLTIRDGYKIEAEIMSSTLTIPS